MLHSPMLSDREIWQAAAVMVKRYGSGAVAEAEKRAGELEGEDDTIGALTWYRIAGAIAELQKTAPDSPLN